MPQEHVVDLLAGYALGILDEEDLLRVVRHLPQCSTCRNELAVYWNAADQLALSVSSRTPPPDLKDKILQRVQPASAPVSPVLSSRSVNARREGGGLDQALRALFMRPSGVLLGAVALLLVVVLALSNLLMWQQVRALQERVPANDTRVVLLEGTYHAPNTHGYLMVFANENYGTLVVEDAPPLPYGNQYQLWLIQDGMRTSGGVFSVDEQGYGTLQISSSQPLEKFSSFGVTIEPEGGSQGPTGDKVLGGDL